MKILSAHQPAYLPWLGYLHKIALDDEFIILDNVQFEKNSFINRNKIKTANGSIFLTIPIEMKGHINKTIFEMKIDEKTNWRKKHWDSIYFSYKKADFFNESSDFFENYYKQTLTSSFVEFNNGITQFILKNLGINTPIKLQSNININSSKQDLIIDLCKETNASAFFFGAQGVNYVDENIFKKNNISCFFQNYNHPKYKQLWGSFEPYQSILDVIFNIGFNNTKSILFDNNIKQLNS